MFHYFIKFSSYISNKL